MTNPPASDVLPVWVFGGGGVGGIAWEIGMLAGFADEGVQVAPSAMVIGTSAGSVVGGQLATGEGIDAMFERQVARVVNEPTVSMSAGTLFKFATAQLFVKTPEEAGRKIGKLAMAADVGTPEERIAVIGTRLSSHEWGDLDLHLTVVDAESGERRVITKADGIPLVHAVAASCAIPLVWPPIVIEGRHYIDGGMRSTLNLDLATGSGPVIALAPSTASFGPWGRISTQREGLGADRTVEVLTRDEASKTAQGRNVMDRSVVPAVARAGREQGRRDAARVAAALAG